MTRARLAGISLCAAVAFVVAACSSDRRDETGTPPTAPSAKRTSALDVSTPLDLGSVMRRTRHAFRRDDKGNITHADRRNVTSIGADGSIHYMPRLRERMAPALVLATAKITRGEQRLDRAVNTAELGIDGAVRVVRGEITERVENASLGLEQSWTFSEKPAGEGDLAVHVRASGYRLEPREDAVAFVDDATKTKITYGAARFVDANGEASDVQLSVDAGDVVVTVPRDVIERAAYPAVLDPTVGTEIAFDTPIVGASAQPEYFVVAKAGKDGTVLVVWGEDRLPGEGQSTPLYWVADGSLWGARVGSDGTVLDPTGILIAGNNEDYQDAPRIAYDDNGTWLVTWGQYSQIEYDCEFFNAARISSAGVVLDPQTIHLGCAYDLFDANFDGTNFHVIGAAGFATYGWRIPPAGKVINPKATTLKESTRFSGDRLVCDHKTMCALTWSGSPMLISKIGANGSLDVPAGTAIPNANGSPVPGFDGTNLLIGFGSSVVRLSPSTLAPIDASPIVVSSSLSIQSIAWNGTDVLFTQSVGSQLVGARLTKAGATPDSASSLKLTTAASVSDWDVTGGAGQWTAAWLDKNYQVRVERIDANGAPIDVDGKNIVKAANLERGVAVAKNGTGFLGAWEDWRNVAPADHRSTPAIYYARLDGVGTPLDAPAKQLAATGETVSVASDGTDYLAVWAQPYPTYGITAARISGATGAVLGSPFALDTNGNSPRVVWDGTEYLVAWAGGYGSPYGTPAVRVTKDGTVLDSTPLDVASGGTGGKPLLASAGAKGTLVVLENGDTFGRILTPAFTLVGSAPFPIWQPDTWDDFHDVTYDVENDTYIVVFRQALHDDTPRGDIVAVRLDSTGTVLDSPPLHIASTTQPEIEPAVVTMADGIGPLILWSDPRNPNGDHDYDIYGAVLRIKDGALLDPGGFVVSGGRGNDVSPHAINVGPGKALVAYERVDDASGVGSMRVKARFVTSGKSSGEGCATNTDCASRFCADNVCCDRACDDPCETCGKTKGTCTKVVSEEDATGCSGDRTCDESSKCRSKRAGPCTTTADCLDGTCAQGVCCDRPCDAACETCAAPAGTCTPRAARSAGTPSCAPYACDGKSATCSTECTSDDQCPAQARCDAKTKQCFEGPLCKDERFLGNGSTLTDCSPYTCEVAACRTTCRDAHDCVYPAVCDEHGACVPPPATIYAGGGCSCKTTGDASGSTSSGLLALVVLAIVRGSRRVRFMKCR